MDPITIGAMVVAAVILLNNSKKPDGGHANGGVVTPPPDDNGMMAGTIEIGRRIGPGLMHAADGVMGINARVRDQIMPVGGAAVGNLVQDVSTGGANLMAFTGYMGGSGASVALAVGTYAAEAAASTKTGQAVNQAANDAAKKAQENAKKAAKAAQQAAETADRAGAAYVSEVFGTWFR